MIVKISCTIRDRNRGRGDIVANLRDRDREQKIQSRRTLVLVAIEHLDSISDL